MKRSIFILNKNFHTVEIFLVKLLLFYGLILNF